MITNRLISEYDRIAEAYALLNYDMPPDLIQSAEEFINFGGANGLVLDIGCGTGRDMSWFESKGVSITGIDLSEEMLKQALYRVNSSLIKMDMRELKFEDQSFQGVWCNASLLHLPKNEIFLALSEIKRVLVPNGLAFLSFQEGNGEGWEISKIESAKRWMARYNKQEISEILVANHFKVIQFFFRSTPIIDWLHFLVTPENL